jgi:hypothetical protein
MVITAMQTALGKDANQAIVYLMVENAGRIVKLINNGWVRVIVANVIVASFGLISNRFA